MTQHCTGCGKELLDDSQFCSQCGKQTEMIKKDNADAVVKKRSTKTGKKNPVMIIILIFAVLGVIYVFYTYADINGFISPMGGLSGTWEGSGTFTNNCQNPACRYVGTMNPPSVFLQLQQNGNSVYGTVTINIPQSQVQTLISGQGCSGFDHSQSQIYNGVISGSRLTFADLGGNIWSLNILSDNLQGVVGNSMSGCLGLQGDVSLSRK
ncbi:MAG: zinc-ribbon domain-containing protein [Euryarchaeota archaeon]|nr:zinc-ribbon domain-containing protein [Euryarchaeota archaeon]